MLVAQLFTARQGNTYILRPRRAPVSLLGSGGELRHSLLPRMALHLFESGEVAEQLVVTRKGSDWCQPLLAMHKYVYLQENRFLYIECQPRDGACTSMPVLGSRITRLCASCGQIQAESCVLHHANFLTTK